MKKVNNFIFFNCYIDKCINFVYTIVKGDDSVEARLQKWGNSLGIRIPSSILKTLNLKNNDQVDINYEDDKIVISKSKNNKISLEERFKEYKGENLAKEFNWDLPRGKEIW